MNRGAEAEALAAKFLEARGLSIIDRNFRCRGGEIDLVAREGECLVFVEVRLRGNERFGGAAASISAAKQQRLRLAAELYLQRFRRTPPARFDAILFDALDANRIEWLRDII